MGASRQSERLSPHPPSEGACPLVFRPERGSESSDERRLMVGRPFQSVRYFFRPRGRISIRTAMSIVPDDFDLDEARSARTTTDKEDLDRCPHCGSVKVHRKDGNRNFRYEHPDEDWYCGACSEHFNSPE